MNSYLYVYTTKKMYIHAHIFPQCDLAVVEVVPKMFTLIILYPFIHKLCAAGRLMVLIPTLKK